MYYSLTVTIFRGIRDYFKKYGSTLPVFLCLGAVSHAFPIFVAAAVSLFSWVIVCKILDSVLDDEKTKLEASARDAEISKQIEETRIKILSKYEKLLEAKDYKQLLDELKKLN